MEELHQLDYCSQFARDLLRIIHKGLLHPDKRQRWDCAKIPAELVRIRGKCDSNEAYSIALFEWEGGPQETFTLSVLNGLPFSFSKVSITKLSVTM